MLTLITSGTSVIGFLATIIFSLWALVDCIKSDEHEVRNLPKVSWAIIIIFTWLLGAILWVTLGRPRKINPHKRNTRRFKGPDDDPDFLNKI